MRGNSNASLDIFNKMKSKKGQAQVGAGTTITADTLREGAMGGGAYESIQRMVKEQSVKEDLRVNSSEEASFTKHSNKANKKIDVANYMSNMIELVSFNPDDIDNVVKVLLYLYLNGELAEYEIEGIDKDSVLSKIEKFIEIVDEVLK